MVERRKIFGVWEGWGFITKEKLGYVWESLTPEGVSYRDGGARGLQLEIGEEFLDGFAEVGWGSDEA